MKINKDSLKARANNLSKEFNITQNVVYNRFFFDAFLIRLVNSPYKNKFVLKGGLYLSSLLGIDTRTTMDIDFYLKKLKFEKEKIVKMITEISLLDIGDGITFDVINAKTIRDEDLYGGYQIILQAKLENIRYQFSVDVVTGDPIVPSEQSYNYKCLVTGDVLPVNAYSLESVIAEKLQTVFSRGITNSRCKDYFDLFILRKTQWANIDNRQLKEAYKQTCKYRNFNLSKDNASILLDEIKRNESIQTRWKSYGKNSKHAKDITLDDVITAIIEWVGVCYE